MKTIILVTSVQQIHSKNSLLVRQQWECNKYFSNYSNRFMQITIQQNSYILSEYRVTGIIFLIQRKCIIFVLIYGIFKMPENR